MNRLKTPSSVILYEIFSNFQSYESNPSKYIIFLAKQFEKHKLTHHNDGTGTII
jgi:hypothetical protein